MKLIPYLDNLSLEQALTWQAFADSSDQFNFCEDLLIEHKLPVKVMYESLWIDAMGRRFNELLRGRLPVFAGRTLEFKGDTWDVWKLDRLG